MEHDWQMQRSEMQTDSTAISHLSKTYAATLGEIITKSNFGRQQLDPKKEMPLAIAVWYEVLYGVVPEHRLNDCYLFVKRNRTNAFALQPEELSAAWNEIRSNERYKTNPAKQITHGFCAKCNNTGSEIIYNVQTKRTSARPCNH